MYLLALDASTKSTGFAVFKDNQLLVCNCITASSSDLYKRIHKMVDSILTIVGQMKIEKIVMEEVIPDYSKNTNTFRALMYLQALIHIELHDKHPNVQIEMIYPSSWRSACGIEDGRASKREQKKQKDIEFANQKYGLSLTNDDAADAVCIGHAFLHPKKEKDYSAALQW